MFQQQQQQQQHLLLTFTFYLVIAQSNKHKWSQFFSLILNFNLKFFIFIHKIKENINKIIFFCFKIYKLIFFI